MSKNIIFSLVILLIFPVSSCTPSSIEVAASLKTSIGYPSPTDQRTTPQFTHSATIVPYPISPTQTIQPTYPYPNTERIPTQPGKTPVSSPTLHHDDSPSPSPFPTPIPYFLKDQCTVSQTYTKCKDDLLQIEFEYPSSWGEITGQLLKSLEAGYKYSYEFSNLPAFGKQYVEAGGRSHDFHESRGMVISDFKGFLNASPREICLSTHATPYCVTVQPNVIFMIEVPVAENICDPGPGTLFQPMGVILINLLKNPTINGFVIASPFLSEQFQNELDSLLGITSEQGPTLCDNSHMEAYNQKVQEMIDAFMHNRLEEVSQHNLESLIHLAHSIKFLR
jgi:hypothetical protein